MQFGKFHGWAFIALGALLILVQVFLSFRPQQDVISSGETATVVHKNTLLPGILGGVSLILGVGLFVSNRNKPQE
jgi:hypothetical protein